MATVGPVIKAQDGTSPSALGTFIFDLMTVVLSFSSALYWAQRTISASGLGPVNDTSSVIAHRICLFDPAGSGHHRQTDPHLVLPIVLVFAWIHARRTPKTAIKPNPG